MDSAAPRLRRIATVVEAKEALDYFNGFHDGFIKRLSIVSHDEFKSHHEQAFAGELDLEITFAHNNYQDGRRPYNQLVEARFNGVKDLRINFSGKSYEWSINSISIGETNRLADTGNVEACLKGVLVQNRLEDGRQWVLHEDMSFTFRSCVLTEI